MDFNFPELPSPPYTAVVFSNQHSGDDFEGYEKMSQWMLKLVEQQPGFLGMFSTRDERGFGVTVSFWTDRSSAAAWREIAEHQSAQEMAKQKWYSQYRIQICEIVESLDGP